MTKAQIKYIQSLSRQKYRKAYNSYLVEGNKNAKEWLASDLQIEFIVAIPEWLTENQNLIARHREATLLTVKDFELQKISLLKTAQSVLLVVKETEQNKTPHDKAEWSFYLEDIKDPGNMGTIIRIADWFGIHHIFHSEECVEIHNPKVVQATMGSSLRVQLHRISTEILLEKVIEKDYPLFASALDGEDLKINHQSMQAPGVIALGNESIGLSELLLQQATYRLKIPGNGSAESLNVGVAAGIFCAFLI